MIIRVQCVYKAKTGLLPHNQDSMYFFPQAPLDGKVTGGSVKGGEEWTNGAKICFDWDNDKAFTYTCYVVRGKLVDCKHTGSPNCPF